MAPGLLWGAEPHPVPGLGLVGARKQSLKHSSLLSQACFRRSFITPVPIKGQVWGRRGNV